MAFYIPITLLERQGDLLLYEYSQPIHAAHPTQPQRLVEVGRHVGVVQLNVGTGECVQIRGDEWDAGTYFVRVRAKLLQHLKQGPMPEQTCYAA